MENGTTYAHVLEKLKVGTDKGNTEEGEVGSCGVNKAVSKSSSGDTRRTVVVLAVTAEVDGDLFGLQSG